MRKLLSGKKQQDAWTCACESVDWSMTDPVQNSCGLKTLTSTDGLPL